MCQKKNETSSLLAMCALQTRFPKDFRTRHSLSVQLRLDWEEGGVVGLYALKGLIKNHNTVAGAISSFLHHTPKMGDILISGYYCAKNVSNNSIGGHWWRNDPCVSSFLLQNFFPDNFVNMSHTNFWQFFQISDLILHDKCLFKLFHNTHW